jgi:hypothetical protein
MLVRAHFTRKHFFAWGLQNGLDVNLKLACSGEELMSFVSRGIEPVGIVRDLLLNNLAWQ